MGHRFTSNTYDRLLASYNVGQHRSGADDSLSELGEEEVWSMARSQHEHAAPDEPNNVRRWKEERHLDLVGGLSSEMKKNETSSMRAATSAPMKVPNRSRITRVDSVEGGVDSVVVVEEAAREEWDRVPPHVYLAREYGGSRKGAATSVLEGVGRTLKGRDMSRIRDAVWNRTGFFG